MQILTILKILYSQNIDPIVIMYMYMIFSLCARIYTLCLPSYVCNYSSITPLDDYSLDNHLRPYLYQTHAGELHCAPSYPLIH